MQYNLIRNGSLQSVTTSGTGNVALTWSQLESLIDGTTASGGVSLTTSGILYLDADLSQRIKVDGIRLYASDLTKSANIKFYYKNETNDSYTTLSTSVSTYYYTTIADPSAPRYVRVTVSGVAIDLHEFQIFNDDYIVAFGSDGSTFAEYLEDTPVGSEGTAQSIELFNNGNGAMAADAYTVIDYTGAIADEYVKISASQNGTYYGINDGVLIEDDDALNSTHIWSMGAFSNTQVSSDDVVLTAPTVGTYTTPIFKLDNQYDSSYFITKGTTITGSISYNAGAPNGTIRVKSSDTEPSNIYEGYTLDHAGETVIVKRWLPATGGWTSYLSFGNWDRPVSVVINRRNGNIAVGVYDFSGGGTDSGLYIYTRSAGLIASTSTSLGTYPGGYAMEFDKSGGVWNYNDEGYGTDDKNHLYHFSPNLTVTVDIYDAQLAFLYDLAVEMDGDGVWYTDQIDDLVIHRNTIGTLIHSIALETPRAICGTLDNGCWVIDNKDGDDAIAYRYDSSGSLVKTVTLPETPTYNTAQAQRMTTDYNNGFWYMHGVYVYHVTRVGVVDVGPVLASNDPDRIRGAHNGCFVIDLTYDLFSFVDKDAGAVTAQRSIGSIQPREVFGVFSFDLDTALEFQDTTGLLPVSYDPVWYTGGTLEWQEVRKDGYFLPKYQYHQVEVTLRGDATLEKILMPPAIKTEDIQAQQSQSIYIKTDIPNGADITGYEARIKTWWGV